MLQGVAEVTWWLCFLKAEPRINISKSQAKYALVMKYYVVAMNCVKSDSPYDLWSTFGSTESQTMLEPTEAT